MDGTSVRSESSAPGPRESTGAASSAGHPPSRREGNPLLAGFLPLLALALLPSLVAGQARDPGGAPRPEPQDSALLRARQAQDRFEDLRRRHLSRNHTWGSGACDARVGRMCWRYHPLLRWRPRGEPGEVIQARDSLLLELAAAAGSLPEDPWILGQRIRYLVEANRPVAALSLARECGGAPSWWCGALEGMVLHRQGNFPAAERAFDGALQAMEPDTAQAWSNTGPLLDRDLRNLLVRSSQEPAMEDPTALRILWQLADPLLLLPGNDRRTEHLARQTTIRILSRAATPHDLRWGEDMAELLLRYGWEMGWERVPPRTGDLGGVVNTVGFEHPDVRRFLPPGRVLSGPTAVQASPWAPSMWPHARSGYAPAYAPVFLPMESRFLLFPRGGGALVAATFSLPPDTTSRTREGIRGLHVPPPAFGNGEIRSGFFLVDPEGDVAHAMLRSGDPEGVLYLDAPTGEYLASVEVLDPEAGRAGRHRNGLVVPTFPPDVPALSDLLLMGGDSLPASTLEGLDRLLVGSEVEEGEPLVVGWELWGLGWREETLRYRLTMEQADPGILGRVRGLFGGGPSLPVLEWEEAGPLEPGPVFQRVSITLPEVDPGEYTLRLEVALEGRNMLERRQRVRIVEAGGRGGGGGGP